jgi:hypothetical protein
VLAKLPILTDNSFAIYAQKPVAGIAESRSLPEVENLGVEESSRYTDIASSCSSDDSESTDSESSSSTVFGWSSNCPKCADSDCDGLAPPNTPDTSETSSPTLCATDNLPTKEEVGEGYW